MYTFDEFLKDCFNNPLAATNLKVKIKTRSKVLDLKAIGIDYKQVNDIWNAIAKFVMKNLENEKGVDIPNFGKFSIDKKTGKHCFTFSTKFKMEHHFESNSKPFQAEEPSVESNNGTIALYAKVDRDIMKIVTNHMFSVLGEAFHQQEFVEISFGEIGTFICRNKLAGFKYYYLPQAAGIEVIEAGGGNPTYMKEPPPDALTLHLDGASKQINPISTQTNNNNYNNIGNGNDVSGGDGSMMMMKERPKSTDTNSLSRPSTTTTVTTVTTTQSSRPETHNLKTTVPIAGEEEGGELENTKTLGKTETILPPLDINLNGPSYMKMTEERKAQTITNQSSISYTPTKQLIPLQTSPILPFFAIPQTGAGAFRRVNKEAYDKTLDKAFKRFENEIHHNEERKKREDYEIEMRLNRGYELADEQRREREETSALQDQFLQQQMKLKILQAKKEREIEKIQDPPFDYDSLIEAEAEYKHVQQNKFRRGVAEQIKDNKNRKEKQKKKELDEENRVIETISRRMREEQEQRKMAKYQTKVQLRNAWSRQKQLNDLSREFQKSNLGLLPSSH